MKGLMWRLMPGPTRCIIQQVPLGLPGLRDVQQVHVSHNILMERGLSGTWVIWKLSQSYHLCALLTFPRLRSSMLKLMLKLYHNISVTVLILPSEHFALNASVCFLLQAQPSFVTCYILDLLLDHQLFRQVTGPVTSRPWRPLLSPPLHCRSSDWPHLGPPPESAGQSAGWSESGAAVQLHSGIGRLLLYNCTVAH